MRLIEASTLKLVSKHDAEVPPYAILSHTWGNDEDEVSFKEMQAFAVESRKTTVFAHPFARKTGFAKIQQSARLALSQGLHYIWIDTCCIDKSSSAELSEAINSMFRWYQGSTVCYAFLSDVRVPLSEASGVKVWKDSMIPYLLDSLQDMQRSRWFTRGWTLQELVAPRTVEFYSQDWSLIGDKNNHSGLRKLISSITGIDEAVLDGSRSLQSLGVAERMHWASRRVTTRLEDQAYCLMGMFDINMPLLYGEGSKAFIRLQEEILKSQYRPTTDVERHDLLEVCINKCLSQQVLIILYLLGKQLMSTMIRTSISRVSLHQVQNASGTPAILYLSL